MPDVKKALLAVKEKQEEYKELFGNTYKESGYVFTHEDGSVLRPDCVTRTFKRVLKSHNVPVIRFHDLRHSCASILYDKGWELKDVQEWLGHADIETTANIYTHISKERKKMKTDTLSGTFNL